MLNAILYGKKRGLGQEVRSLTEGFEEAADPTKFAPGECESQLRMYILVNDQDRNEATNWSHRIWETSNYPDHDTSKTHGRIEGVRIYGYIFNLNEMYSKDAITKCVEFFKENAKRKLGVNL